MTLRERRARLGLDPIEVASRAGCSIGVVMRAEFGIQVPMDTDVRSRLARVYGLSPAQYVRYALDAAENDLR